MVSRKNFEYEFTCLIPWFLKKGKPTPDGPIISGPAVSNAVNRIKLAMRMCFQGYLFCGQTSWHCDPVLERPRVEDQFREVMPQALAEFVPEANPDRVQGLPLNQFVHAAGARLD